MAHAHMLLLAREDRRAAPRQRISARISNAAHARLTVLARPIGESRTVEMLLDAVTIAYRRRPLEEVLEDIRDAAWEVENGGDRGVHRRPPQVEALAS